jgi:hypothetical protein
MHDRRGLRERIREEPSKEEWSRSNMSKVTSNKAQGKRAYIGSSMTMMHGVVQNWGEARTLCGVAGHRAWGRARPSGRTEPSGSRRSMTCSQRGDTSRESAEASGRGQRMLGDSMAAGAGVLYPASHAPGNLLCC